MRIVRTGWSCSHGSNPRRLQLLLKRKEDSPAELQSRTKPICVRTLPNCSDLSGFSATTRSCGSWLHPQGHLSNRAWPEGPREGKTHGSPDSSEKAVTTLLGNL